MRFLTRMERGGMVAAVGVLVLLTPGKTVPDTSPPERPPEITSRTLTCRPDRIDISFQIPALTLRTVRNSSDQAIDIAGAMPYDKPGLPEVPVIHRFIAVPTCDRLELTADPQNVETIRNVALQPHARPDRAAGGETGARDEALYSQDATFPGTWARLVDVQRARGQTLARVEIYPVQFNPRRRMASCPREIRLHITPVNPRGPVAVNAGPLQSVLDAVVPNVGGEGGSPDKATSLQSTSGGPGQVCWCNTPSDDSEQAADYIIENCAADYLIIVADELSHGVDSTLVDSLATKRAQFNGFNVAIARMGQIDATPANTGTPAMIQNFVRSIYASQTAGHMGDRKLGYLLLIGDAVNPSGQIILPPYYPNPANYVGDWTNGSDGYFALMDGDIVPDLLVGRLPVDADDEHWELGNVVRKLTSFEPISTGATWADRILLMSGGDDDSFTFQGEGLTGFQNYFDAIEELFASSGKSFVQMHRLAASSDSLFSETVCDSIANGFSVVGLFDHANPVNFANAFFPLHYDMLQNDDSPSLILSIGSYSGFFDRLGNDGWCCPDTAYAGLPCKSPPTPIDDCDALAERLVLQPAGAIGVVAYARTNGAGYAQNVFVDAFRALLDHKLGELGSLVLGTKLLSDDNYTPSALNLLGDPALNIDYQFDTVAEDSLDLAVSGLDLAFTSGAHDYAPSGSATMKVVVSNLWKTTAYSVPVEIWEGVPGEQGSSLLNDFTLSSVPAHGNASWTGSIGAFSVGDHDVYVVADPDDGLNDPVRTNNVSYRTLHVRDYASGFPREVGILSNRPIEIADAILGTPRRLELMVGSRLYGADGDSLATAFAPLGNFLRSDKRHYVASSPAGSSTVVILYEAGSGTSVQSFSVLGSVRDVIALDHGLPGGMLVALQTREVDVVQNKFDSNIRLYGVSGQQLWARKIGDAAHYTLDFGDFVMAAGDVTSDGVSDVVYALSPSSTGAADSLGVIDGETGGRVWTIATGDFAFGRAYLRLVDIQNDGDLDIVTNTQVSSSSNEDRIQCYDREGSLVWQVTAGSVTQWKTFFAAADLDHDGVKEIVFADDARLGVITTAGSSATVSAEVNLTGYRTLVSTPLAADIDGDGSLEIIVFCRAHHRYLNECSLELLVYEDDLTPITPTYDFPCGSVDALPLEAAASDIDGDGKIEVVFATADGLLHAVRVGTSAGKVDWGSAEGDAMRTGLYEQVLSGTYDEPVAIVNRARVLETTTFAGGLTITAPADVQVGVSDSLIVSESFALLGSANDSVQVRIDDLASAGSYWGGFIYGDAQERGRIHHAIVTDALTAFENTKPLEIGRTRISNVTNAAVVSADSLWLLESAVSGSGGDGLVLSGGAFAEIDGSLIENVELKGFNLASGDTVIVDSTTVRSCDIGIYATGETTVLLSNSTVEDCSTYGANFKDASFDVAATAFNGNDIGLLMHRSLDSWAAGTVNDCSFAYNVDGIWILGSGPSTSLTIDDCTIDHSTTSGIYAQDYGPVTITDNTVTNGAVGLYAFASSPEIRAGNRIQNNTSGIKCDDNSHAVVESCTVNNNTYGINIVSGNPDVGHVSGGSSIGYNILKPNTTYHVRNATAWTISAQQNYWPQSPPTICYPKPSKLFGSVDSTAALCSQPSLSSPGFWAGRDGKGAPAIPTRFSLSQNYPNPFNPTTTVSFEVARSSRVQVVIYDVTGRLVTVLLDEPKAPGRYAAAWNGHNRHGQPVASGIYFLRMRAGSFVDTKKLLLLK